MTKLRIQIFPLRPPDNSSPFPGAYTTQGAPLSWQVNPKKIKAKIWWRKGFEDGDRNEDKDDEDLKVKILKYEDDDEDLKTKIKKENKDKNGDDILVHFLSNSI